MTNLPYSSRIVRVSEKNLSRQLCRAAKGIASVTKYSERISWRDRITLLRRIGDRAPVVLSSIITRCYWQPPISIRSSDSIDYAIRQFFDPGGGGEKGGPRYRDACPDTLLRSGWSPCSAESSLDVSSRPRRPSYTPFANWRLSDLHGAQPRRSIGTHRFDIGT